MSYVGVGNIAQHIVALDEAHEVLSWDAGAQASCDFMHISVTLGL